MSINAASRPSAERRLIDGIVAGLASIAPGSLWPGSDPVSLPLAVGIGSAPATWLIHHGDVDGCVPASPLAAFARLPLLRRDGIDERLVGNSTAEIAGQLTATIIVEDGMTVRHLIALAAHECFHVFQQGGTVVHERYLALASEATRITVLGQVIVTTASGDRPLFTGIDRAEILVRPLPFAVVSVWDADALATVGVRIDGPFIARPTGPDTLEIETGGLTLRLPDRRCCYPSRAHAARPADQSRRIDPR